jgi:hypothetical protein
MHHPGYRHHHQPSANHQPNCLNPKPKKLTQWIILHVWRKSLEGIAALDLASRQPRYHYAAFFFRRYTLPAGSTPIPIFCVLPAIADGTQASCNHLPCALGEPHREPLHTLTSTCISDKILVGGQEPKKLSEKTALGTLVEVDFLTRDGS